MKDFLQNYKIIDNEYAAKLAGSETNANRQHLKTLNEKVDTIALMATAALELLREVGVSESRIASKMHEIDLRDGSLDGKLSASQHCPSCDNKISGKRQFCFMCGEKLTHLPGKR
ncbi:hypothetical protein Q670_03215 [Alcanivorax sp. P2S70]|uniref:hypothetical protein n=1 Tax=Alcanivorax sp. P2S70 TaxID=1397527 RepID=UPI0003B31890|nr:hypothetical protein [Alcanivorax sp. P2S70]ERP89408.1 hypothetical protein Q670_03215 [Alcanivorax sp. P2S70]